MTSAKTPLTIFDKLYKAYGGSMGKMLIHTGVIGWALSSAAQIFAIAINDKIPKEQKMFMIPQEFADACVNILSFYAVTQTFSAVGKKLVSTGKWLPENIKKHLVKKGFGAKIGKLNTNLETIIEQMPSRIKTSYGRFEHGMDVTATTIGSIISCNLITPLVRNLYASHRQQTQIAKMNNKNEPLQKPNQQNYGQNNIKAFNPYRTNGSLKV